MFTEKSRALRNFRTLAHRFLIFRIFFFQRLHSQLLSQLENFSPRTRMTCDEGFFTLIFIFMRKIWKILFFESYKSLFCYRLRLRYRPQVSRPGLFFLIMLKPIRRLFSVEPGKSELFLLDDSLFDIDWF